MTLHVKLAKEFGDYGPALCGELGTSYAGRSVKHVRKLMEGHRHYFGPICSTCLGILNAEPIDGGYPPDWELP